MEAEGVPAVDVRRLGAPVEAPQAVDKLAGIVRSDTLNGEGGEALDMVAEVEGLP